MSVDVFIMLCVGTVVANLTFGAVLVCRFFLSAADKTPTRRWFWFWAVGLVLSFGGFGGLLHGGIWLILLGTIVYAIAALRTSHKQVMPPQS